MILLDATTDSLEGVLGEAISTTQPEHTTMFSEEDQTNFQHEGFSKQRGDFSGTSDFTMVAAPAANTNRLIIAIYIYNRDDITHEVTVKLEHTGPDEKIFFKGDVVAGGQIQMNRAGDWIVRNENGVITNTGGASGSSTFTGLTDTPSSFAGAAGQLPVVNTAVSALAFETVIPPSLNETRCTLTDGTAVTTSDVASSTTIYMEPLYGQRIALYDGTRWGLVDIGSGGISVGLGTLTSGRNYDVWCRDVSGTATLDLSAAWNADNVTRTDAVARQDGVYVKSGDATRRLVATFRTISTTTTTDSAEERFLWNAHPPSRRPRQLRREEATNSWTYSTDTFRQANGATDNIVGFVRGLDEDAVYCTLAAMHSNTTVSNVLYAAIGLDSSTAIATDSTNATVSNHAASQFHQLTATYCGYPGLGYHDLRWLERAQGATGTFYGEDVAGSSPYRNGLLGVCWA